MIDPKETARVTNNVTLAGVISILLMTAGKPTGEKCSKFFSSAAFRSGYNTTISGSRFSFVLCRWQLCSGSEQHPQTQSQGQSSQYRVARVMQDDSCDLVFDLTAGTCDDGHLRVVHFHIGDNDEEMESTDFVLGVRAIVEEIPDDPTAEVILLDSDADASVFPLSLVGDGVP